MLPAGCFGLTILAGQISFFLGQRYRTRPVWFAACAAAGLWMVVGGAGLSVGFGIYWLGLASANTALGFVATAALCGFACSTWAYFYAASRLRSSATGEP